MSCSTNVARATRSRGTGRSRRHSPGRVGDRDHDVTADRVVQVLARLERRDRLRAQHGARGRVADLHRLGPALVVPVEQVQLEVVRQPVGEVDVDGEAGGGVPDGGDAVGEPGTCKARGSVEVGGPGVGRLAGGRDRVAGGEAGRAGDDVVAARAVRADPCPLRRRVLPDERRGCPRGSRNRPLRTALAPAVRVIVITMLPLTA